ncbi:MAG TPA: hypothetical protein VGO86_14790 [Candidatus Dormibacteraeota bacterium]
MKGLFRRSSNYTFLVELCDSEETGPPMLAVYKPAEGESPLWDFPTGTLYRREVASYLVAKHLGWPRIPPTVVREEGPHGIGALQMYVAAEPDRHYLASGGEPADRWIEVALFDVLTNNADRKSGHCLTDGDGEVWVIDHGLTFHVDPKLRTVIWDFAGQPVPARLHVDLARLAGSLTSGDLVVRLGELLSRRELAVLRRRLQAMLRPGWQLPHPTSAWSVPWPPV